MDTIMDMNYSHGRLTRSIKRGCVNSIWYTKDGNPKVVFLKEGIRVSVRDGYLVFSRTRTVIAS